MSGLRRKRRVRLQRDQVCPLCKAALFDTAPQNLAVCPGCRAVYHLDCVGELGAGQCSTTGCTHGLSKKEVQVPTEEPTATGEPRSLVFRAYMGLLNATSRVLFAVLVGYYLAAAIAALSGQGGWLLWVATTGAFVLADLRYSLFERPLPKLKGLKLSKRLDSPEAKERDR